MAATFKRIFRQDLTKPLQIYYNLELVFSKDNLANEIQIELYNGSDVYSGGGSVSGTAIRADGRTVPIENGTISGNVVTVALTEECMDVPGTLQVYVKLTSGNVKTTIFAGVFTAIRTETDAIIDPGTIIPSITELINQIDAAIDSIPADYSTLLGSVASTYSASKTYAVGDYVWYDGSLYRCTTAITTAEAWTSAHWTAAVLSDDLSAIKSAISNIEDEIFTSGNLLNVSTFYSNNNNAVTNNGDGTFTFGTTDRGTTCWESIGEVPAGDYELIGLPSSANGWVYVSTEASVSSGVIKNNSDAESVSYTNQIRQKLYILVYLRANPSASFVLAPAIDGGKISVIETLTDKVSDLETATDTLNADVGEVGNRVEILEPEATDSDIGKYLKVKSVEDGTVTEYEFDTPQTGGDTDDLYVDVISEFKPEYTIHNNMMIDSSDGSIDLAGTTSQKVMEFPVTGCSKFRMQASAYGGNSGALYAFYTAESFALCGPSTIIGSVNTYNRSAAIYEYTIPDDANWCCVYISTQDYIGCVKTESKIKGYASIADEYDPSAKYTVGDCVTHDGLMYVCITSIQAPETWNAEHWNVTNVNEQIAGMMSAHEIIGNLAKFQVGTINSSTGAIETNIKYRVVTKNLIHFQTQTTVTLADGYGGQVYYYNSAGIYTGTFYNLADVAYNRNIIPAGSYVRFQIEVTGDTTTLTDLDIPRFVDKITYPSEYAKQSEQIVENKYAASNGWTARMYAKGASPKSFSHSPAIICAGQSNIAGVIPAESIPPNITFPMTHIMYSPTNKPTTFDEGITGYGSWGVDLPMYKALNDLGNTVYVIKYAEAGTGIDIDCGSTDRWTAFYEDLPSISNSLLYDLETKIRALGASNPNAYDVRAMVWHQGENDSAFSNGGNVAIPDRYYDNFKYVIAYVRGVVGNERLPIIYGSISHNSIAYDPRIEAAQWRIASEDPNTYCIDMSGAGLIDDYHFNPDAAVYFGYKAYDALIDFGVVSGTKINPTPPWET